MSHRRQRYKVTWSPFPPVIHLLQAYQGPARWTLECNPVYIGQTVIRGKGFVVFKSSRFHGTGCKLSLPYVFYPCIHRLKIKRQTLQIAHSNMTYAITGVLQKCEVRWWRLDLLHTWGKSLRFRLARRNSRENSTAHLRKQLGWSPRVASRCLARQFTQLFPQVCDRL